MSENVCLTTGSVVLNVTYVPFNIFTVKIPTENGETTPHKPT